MLGTPDPFLQSFHRLPQTGKHALDGALVRQVMTGADETYMMSPLAFRPA